MLRQQDPHFQISIQVCFRDKQGAIKLVDEAYTYDFYRQGLPVPSVGEYLHLDIAGEARSALDATPEAIETYKQEVRDGERTEYLERWFKVEERQFSYWHAPDAGFRSIEHGCSVLLLVSYAASRNYVYADPETNLRTGGKMPNEEQMEELKGDPLAFWNEATGKVVHLKPMEDYNGQG